MTQTQFRIMFREISVVLGTIGLLISIYFEYPVMQWIFSAYLMWNAFRLITHVYNKIRGIR
jgi:hypothetical protein